MTRPYRVRRLRRPERQEKGGRKGRPFHQPTKPRYCTLKLFVVAAPPSALASTL
jgi:hypothetical protein